MPQCKSCGQEISWDDEMRRQLRFNGPVQLVDGKYTKHLCPNYKPKPSTSIGSYVSKAPNPNNYTGSSSDYTHTTKQQTVTQTPLTVEVMKELLDERDYAEDIDFLRQIVINLTETVNNLRTTIDEFKTDNPAYRAMLDFQARMFPVLNQLEQKSQNSDFVIANKLKERYKENYDADIDPDIDEEYKNSITTEKDKEGE